MRKWADPSKFQAAIPKLPEQLAGHPMPKNGSTQANWCERSKTTDWAVVAEALHRGDLQTFAQDAEEERAADVAMQDAEREQADADADAGAAADAGGSAEAAADAGGSAEQPAAAGTVSSVPPGGSGGGGGEDPEDQRPQKPLAPAHAAEEQLSQMTQEELQAKLNELREGASAPAMAAASVLSTGAASLSSGKPMGGSGKKTLSPSFRGAGGSGGKDLRPAMESAGLGGVFNPLNRPTLPGAVKPVSYSDLSAADRKRLMEEWMAQHMAQDKSGSLLSPKDVHGATPVAGLTAAAAAVGAKKLAARAAVGSRPSPGAPPPSLLTSKARQEKASGGKAQRGRDSSQEPLAPPPRPVDAWQEQAIQLQNEIKVCEEGLHTLRQLAPSVAVSNMMAGQQKSLRALQAQLNALGTAAAQAARDANKPVAVTAEK